MPCPVRASRCRLQRWTCVRHRSSPSRTMPIPGPTWSWRAPKSFCRSCAGRNGRQASCQAAHCLQSAARAPRAPWRRGSWRELGLSADSRSPGPPRRTSLNMRVMTMAVEEVAVARAYPRGQARRCAVEHFQLLATTMPATKFPQSDVRLGSR